jgi:hypothetical protein
MILPFFVSRRGYRVKILVFWDVTLFSSGEWFLTFRVVVLPSSSGVRGSQKNFLGPTFRITLERHIPQDSPEKQRCENMKFCKLKNDWMLTATTPYIFSLSGGVTWRTNQRSNARTRSLEAGSVSISECFAPLTEDEMDNAVLIRIRTVACREWDESTLFS